MQTIVNYFSEIGIGQSAYLLITIVVAIGLIVDVARYRMKRKCYCFSCFREDSGWIAFLTFSWFFLLIMALLVLLMIGKDYLKSQLCRNMQHA